MIVIIFKDYFGKGGFFDELIRSSEYFKELSNM